MFRYAVTIYCNFQAKFHRLKRYVAYEILRWGVFFKYSICFRVSATKICKIQLKTLGKMFQRWQNFSTKRNLKPSSPHDSDFEYLRT